jgi:carbamoyltransferase
MPLTILAIHDGHDAGATLLQDGRIVMHSSEERRANSKNARGVPRRSIGAIFERSGVDPGAVDLVALCGTIRNTTPERKVKTSVRIVEAMSVVARSEAATRLGRRVLAMFRKKKEMLGFLAEHGLQDKPIRTYDHHHCHAATAYWHRPWTEDALVLTHDGAGDGLCASVSVGSGPDLTVVAQTPKFHSVANFMYSYVTEYLGLKPWEHEYKVMGMAPYGRAEYCAPILREMFGVEGLHFRNRTGRITNGLRRYYRRRLAGQRFDNLCAACQLVFEELTLQWVRNAIEATDIHRVCGAGGAFLNVKANMLIRERDDVEAFFAYPASDDGGTPVGAAILGYRDLCAEKGVEPELDLPGHMYVGVCFTEAEMEAAIRASELPYRKMEQPTEEIAGLLADGKIVARFDGREELGPRALGNRTIMADPRQLLAIRKLNFAIKQRDFWMPFAASVLEEDADRYIRDCSDWAYWMIEAFHTTPAAQKEIIAGLHPFDLTVRPQIVNDLNPGYRDIIRAFKERTGVGAVLNTSFNLHGFPIVGTPEVALHTLENSALDALALGPFLVTRRD